MTASSQCKHSITLLNTAHAGQSSNQFTHWAEKSDCDNEGCSIPLITVCLSAPQVQAAAQADAAEIAALAADAQAAEAQGPPAAQEGGA
jgi:hypothetical protein